MSCQVCRLNGRGFCYKHSGPPPLRAAEQADGLGVALEDVRAFNAKFAGRPAYERTCARLRMVSEEATELIEELEREPQICHKIAHEALDLVYVALGALVEAGISAEEAEAAWAEIHRANMAKVAPANGGKARKPEGWTPPDVEGAMARAAAPTWEEVSK